MAYPYNSNYGGGFSDAGYGQAPPPSFIQHGQPPFPAPEPQQWSPLPPSRSQSMSSGPAVGPPMPLPRHQPLGAPALENSATTGSFIDPNLHPATLARQSTLSYPAGHYEQQFDTPHGRSSRSATTGQHYHPIDQQTSMYPAHAPALATSQPQLHARPFIGGSISEDPGTMDGYAESQHRRRFFSRRVDSSEDYRPRAPDSKKTSGSKSSTRKYQCHKRCGNKVKYVGDYCSIACASGKNELCETCFSRKAASLSAYCSICA